MRLIQFTCGILQWQYLLKMMAMSFQIFISTWSGCLVIEILHMGFQFPSQAQQCGGFSAWCGIFYILPNRMTPGLEKKKQSLLFWKCIDILKENIYMIYVIYYVYFSSKKYAKLLPTHNLGCIGLRRLTKRSWILFICALNLYQKQWGWLYLLKINKNHRTDVLECKVAVTILSGNHMRATAWVSSVPRCVTSSEFGW